MQISYTPEQEELRRELRSYFAKLMTPERTEALSMTSGEYGTGNAYRETIAQMGHDGWLALGWPKGWLLSRLTPTTSFSACGSRSQTWTRTASGL